MEASRFWTAARFYVGGPISHVRNAALASGVPAETTASTTLAAYYQPGLDIELTSGAAFLYRGAVRLYDADSGREAWFTYERRTDDLLEFVTPVQTSGTFAVAAQGFPAGSTVNQWRDISDVVTGWRRKGTLGDGEFYWTLELEGVEWNSLALFQDASVLVVAEHYDDILGVHAPIILFQGWLDEPKVHGDTDKGGWSCSAQGRRKYLKLQNNTPGVWGGELLRGDIEASPHLQDVAAEPAEGRWTADFSIQNVLDEYAGTLYASLDAPVGTVLDGGPVGAVQEVPIVSGPNLESGQGLRLTMIYPHPAETGVHVRQAQQWVAVYNNTQVEPPNVFPWVGDTRRGGTADNPNPSLPQYAATKGPEEWGNIDLSKYQLVFGGGRTGGTIETLDGGKWRSVYLGSRNGGPTPPIILAPHTGAVLAWDEQVFRSQFSLPDGWPVVELKSLDGIQWGANPQFQHRGAGLGMQLDPDGDWVALRGGPRWTDDTRYFADVASDDGTTITLTSAAYSEPGGGGVTVPGIAAWPGRGYIRQVGSNKLVYYGSKNDGAGTLTDLVRFDIGGGTGLLGGGSVAMYQDTSSWIDFVAFGDILDKIPWDYPGPAAGENTQNQQRDNYIAEQPWGVWTNVATDTPASEPIAWLEPDESQRNFRRPGPYSPDDWALVTDAAKTAPAVPLLQALRRDSVMGAGTFREEAGGGASWYGHDSNSAADWGLMAAPRVGNADAFTNSLFVKYHLAEHDGGTVLVDDTETLGADGLPLQRITTQPNEARNWPDALTDPRTAFMRAIIAGGGTVDFIYTHRGSSEFRGVTKIRGSAGIEIPPNSELTTVINTKAAWNHGGADSFVQRNMPLITGVSLRRGAELADAEVTDVDRGAGTITVRHGQAIGFPSSGSIVLYTPNATPSPDPGITVTSADFGGVYIVTYTSRTDSDFTGCTFPDKVWTSVTTRARQAASTINYPSEMEILLSRENDPADPEIYLGDNPSWDIGFTMTSGSQRSAPALNPGTIDRFFPLGGAAGKPPFAQWVYLRIRKTTDGRRLFINTLRFHRYPTRPQSAEFDPNNADLWSASYWTSTLVKDILLEAGVPATVVFASGGEALRSLPIAEGSIWETCRQLALMSNCLIGETADGYIVFVRDPRASGAPYRSLPRLSFVPEAIWGEIRADERPRNVTSQVIYEARNPGAEELYTIAVPPNPLPYGQVRRIGGKVASSEQGAEMAARLAFRRSNGGWRLSVPTGQIASDLEPGDVIRLAADVDEASRFFSTDFCIAEIDERGKTENDSVTMSLSLDEHVIP